MMQLPPVLHQLGLLPGFDCASESVSSESVSECLRPHEGRGTNVSRGSGYSTSSYKVRSPRVAKRSVCV